MKIADILLKGPDKVQIQLINKDYFTATKNFNLHYYFLLIFFSFSSFLNIFIFKNTLKHKYFEYYYINQAMNLKQLL